MVVEAQSLFAAAMLQRKDKKGKKRSVSQDNRGPPLKESRLNPDATLPPPIKPASTPTDVQVLEDTEENPLVRKPTRAVQQAVELPLVPASSEKGSAIVHPFVHKWSVLERRQSALNRDFRAELAAHPEARHVPQLTD